MSYAITTNKENGTLLIRKNQAASNDNIQVSEMSFAGEAVARARITDIFWNLVSGTLLVNRGANTVFAGGLSGRINLAASGLVLEAGGDEAANLVITTTGTGTVLITMKRYGV